MPPGSSSSPPRGCVPSNASQQASKLLQDMERSPQPDAHPNARGLRPPVSSIPDDNGHAYIYDRKDEFQNFCGSETRRRVATECPGPKQIRLLVEEPDQSAANPVRLAELA